MNTNDLLMRSFDTVKLSVNEMNSIRGGQYKRIYSTTGIYFYDMTTKRYYTLIGEFLQVISYSDTVPA